MRAYYINNGNENGGPFTLEELKNQQIKENTLVWYQGMDEWKHAVDLEDFKPFFTDILAPVQQSAYTLEVEGTKTSQNIFGLKKSYFFLALAFLAIMITVAILTMIGNNKRNELNLKNKQTEFGNVQVELQQKESNEQRIQQEIQKRIESENNNKRRKDSITSRLSEIKVLLIDDKKKLAETKNNLSEIESFELSRPETTKEEQLLLIQNDIENWKREIDQLENEAYMLSLMLERID
ncbi:MAG: preprotein translocase subunit SecG [Flavobacteriales bacterium]|jgi:preprotein translocase subunit SecG